MLEGIEGQVIGKWVRLEECWPELAARIAQDPNLLSELEGAAYERQTSSDSATPLAKLLGEVSASTADEIREFIKDGPRLSEFAYPLARLQFPPDSPLAFT